MSCTSSTARRDGSFSSATVATTAPAPKRLPNGLLPGHIVTVDAGHGGADPGTLGRFFPSGLTEKDVTLKVALLLQEELVSSWDHRSDDAHD